MRERDAHHVETTWSDDYIGKKLASAIDCNYSTLIYTIIYISGSQLLLGNAPVWHF